MSASILADALPARSPQRDPGLREILCPTDLSPESRPALDHVRALAAHFEARVTLYHAVPRPDPEYPLFHRGQTLDEHWTEAAATAERELDALARSLPFRHILALEKVASPARALVAWIRAHRPDLVVMATHGHSGSSQLLLGSVTEQVIQHARRPVLCVRHSADHCRLPYRRLLVPTDLSPASRAAFGYARVIARAFGAQVLAVYVAPHGAPPEVASEAALWRSLRDHFAGVELAVRLEHGRAWERIVAQAAQEDANLVVMACEGADAVGERLLGSNAGRVVRQAPCPVLVV